MGNFFYIVGENQSAILPENKEVIQFVGDNMGGIESEELLMVLGNVFAKGEFFPGPQEVLTSVIHEVVRRWEGYQQQDKEGYCVIITALRLLDGQIEVRPVAVVPVEDSRLTEEDSQAFYTLLLQGLPGFQEEFSQKAYAPDSKLVSIIQDAAVHHQQ
ncbi:hypothetical protein [Desulfogranum mediterraneum]|uniref:hypothetical protein n=1 Tax=Desulfogranum mediterraneum TaxID=160661 RepID=UPI0004037AB4|nr:hypothetical protein [Desulfogranum mediterraneum]